MQTMDDAGFMQIAQSKQQNRSTGYEYNRVRFYARPEMDELATNGGITPMAGRSQEYVDAVLARGGEIVHANDGSKSLRVPAAGRPIFRSTEYCTIQVPGDKTNIIDRPATAIDKERYAKQYAAFRADKNQDEASGTLLTAWGGVPPDRAEEYAFVGVKTVEQLASMSDGNLQKMGAGSLRERTRAADYVKSMQGYAPTAELRTELNRSQDELETLKRQVLELSSELRERRRDSAVEQLASTLSPEALSVVAPKDNTKPKHQNK